MKPVRSAVAVTAAMAQVRSTYRHGDLRRALLEAGLALAADGGPDAVVLREATRRAGVAPNAAYRHFAGRQDLLEAVRQAAVAEGMEAQMAALPQAGDAAQQARARLRAVGAVTCVSRARRPACSAWR